MQSNNRKKLIVIKPNGNSSNRLVQNLHFEVFCMEHNIEYHNPTFENMAKYYSEPCNSGTNRFLNFLQIDLLGRIFRHSKLIKRIFSVVWIISKFGLLRLVRFDWAKPECERKLLKAFEKNDVVYVGGWAFRVPDLVEKHKTEMMRKYALKPKLYSQNELVNKTENWKKDGFTIVGVHIRRGDYKTWKKGIYYYSDDVYQLQMDSVSKQLKESGHEKIAFILFSNEPLNFTENSNLLISHETWYIDHHLMTQCHYLIGPPSTFTLWASNISHAKLFYLFEGNKQLSIS